MSGIKYSQASLSRAQKAFLACKEKLQRTNEMAAAANQRIESFMLRNDRALDQTVKKLGSIREMIKAVKPERVVADHYTYNQDLERQTGALTGKVTTLEKLSGDIHEIETTLLKLQRLIDAESQFKTDCDGILGKLSHLVTNLGRDEQDKSYLNKQKSDLRYQAEQLVARITGLSINFDEDVNVYQKHLEDCQVILGALRGEVETFIEEVRARLAQAESVEGADASLKNQIRTGLASRSQLPDRVEPPQQSLQKSLAFLRNHPARRFFPEMEAHLKGIEQFAALISRQPDYADQKITELLRQAENLAAKYAKLRATSEDYQADVAATYGYFRDLRSRLNVDQKVRVDALADEVADFQDLQIVDEQKYQELIRKILQLREEIMRGLEESSENEFMAMAIKATLAAAGYEILAEPHQEYAEMDAPRTFEIKLTDRLRVKFSLALTGDFIAQVIYRAADATLSANEWAEINYELQKWESGYEKMRLTLVHEGININAPDFKSFDQDRIVIEYVDPSENNQTTRKQQPEVKRKSAGAP